MGLSLRPDSRDLTCNHEHVVLHTGLTCDLASGIASEASIEHCVVGLVTDFVRVTFRYGCLKLGCVLRNVVFELSSATG